MNARSAVLFFLLVSLLTACNLTTPNQGTSSPSLSVTPTTSLPFPTSISTTAPPAVTIIPLSATPSSTDQTVLERAAEVILDLKNQDFIALSGYVHPVDGLRFSPYAFVRDTDQVFSADQVAGLPVDSQIYTWGQFSGSGESIDLNFPEYYSQFIYDVDFANAPQIALNHRLGVSTSTDNILEFYPNSMMVEYYFPGFDPQLDGLDWRSLRLVFTETNNIWYLIGIIHDQWTT
jgi:hypothetical protein